MQIQIELPTKKSRRFLPEDLLINSWETVVPFFKNLKERKIESLEDLEKWLLEWSELEAVFSEHAGWKYIQMSCHTLNKEFTEAYQFYISTIEPQSAPFINEFNKKLIHSPFVKFLNKEGYAIFLRAVRQQVELFREENIPLFTEIETRSQTYGLIASEMMVLVDGKEITMQNAATLLKDPTRKKREEVYLKIHNRRLQDKDKLNTLFTELVQLRDQVARNAGFKNFRDYMFAALGRFDYQVEDCYRFHESIKKEILPIVESIDLHRQEALKVKKLKPWDTEVDISAKPALKPFNSTEELIDKTIKCFYRIRPFYGERLEIMKKMGHLDLESRKGKAPGGYNYPLHEIGVPFIFMNSVGSLRDLITIVHEGGHALHSFLTRDLEITEFKSTPSEVAELASMSMELISMEFWDEFFEQKEELKRAKKEQLEKVLHMFPWIASVDKFQHWIYEHPLHTKEERQQQWEKISIEFGSKLIDWLGHENIRGNAWQNQLHIYEVPFYFIEYAIAQLGAIAIWRNYKKNPKKALDQYENALKLGYTKSIPEIYQTAGISFDFSADYVRELAEFVKKELEELA